MAADRCPEIKDGLQCVLPVGHTEPHQLPADSGWGGPAPIPSIAVVAPQTVPAAGSIDPAGVNPLAGAGAYPVRLMIDPTKTSMHRLWGIPFFGVLARIILAIPVLVGITIIGFVLYIATYVSWIPVLFTGRQADWIYALMATYIDLGSRGGAYVCLLVGGYPLSSDFGVRVEIDRNQHFNRLWGIPFFGVLARTILLIPHFVVLAILWIVAFFLVFVNWIPVLVTGRQADAIVRFLGGTIRWTMRVDAYASLVASPYPPFSLD